MSTTSSSTTSSSATIVTDGLPQFETEEHEEPEDWITSKRTDSGYAVGVNVFDAFAGLEEGMKKLSEFTVSDLKDNDGEYVKKAFYKFASFLLHHKKKGGKNYKPDTQTQYLSNVKNVIVKRFPKEPVLKPNYDEAMWYHDLLAGLRVRGRAEAIKRGDSVKDATLGIRHKLLFRICKYLCTVGSRRIIQERAILTTLYHAVGRGGEVATCNFSLLRWDDDDETLWTTWSQTKTGRFTNLSFHPDAASYVICEFHALASYIITAGASLRNMEPGAPDWLFPSMMGLAEGGASSKASRILKELVGKVEGLVQEHTSHGLRAGSADDMAFNYLVHVVCMISRGDWDWTGECQLFGYLTKSVHVAIAGKALASWADPRKKVAAPTIEIVVEDKKKLLQFAHGLFIFAPEELQPNGRLIGFRNTMVASLLMHFDALRKDCGLNSNSVVDTMVSVATNVKVSIGELRKWGTTIKADFNLRNSQNQQTSGTEVDRAHAAIGILSENLLQERAKIAELDAQVAEQKEQLGRMEMMLETLVQHSLHRSQSASPTRRCQKNDTAMLEEESGGASGKKSSVAGAAVPPPVTVALGQPKDVLFLDLLKMNVIELTSKVSMYGLNFDVASCFGNHVSKSQKYRAVVTYKECHKHATKEERLILKKSKRKSDSDYKAWVSAVIETANNLAGRLLDSIILEHQEMGFEPCKLKQKNMTVSTIFQATVDLKKLKEDARLV